MRLGRKLSEGFAVDHEADDPPAPVTDPAVPVAEETRTGTRAEPVRTGRAPQS